MLSSQTNEKPPPDRKRVATARSQPPSETISEIVVLAAIDRAECHNEKASAPWSEVVEHLGITRSAATTRRLRPLVDRLVATGAAKRSVLYGIDVCSVTPKGRRQLSRARKAQRFPKLPESPQHRQWRRERANAASEIDNLRQQVGHALEQARALLIAESSKAESWHALATCLHHECTHMARAIYALYEWAEPGDEYSDSDARHLAKAGA
jgi:DNA-binding MarR family transcriptional regulator